MDLQAEGDSRRNSRYSTKTLSFIFIPLIVFFSSVSMLLPPYLANTYVIVYIISLTIIALVLGIRVFRYHRDPEFRHALMGFLIAHMLFWAGGISWTISMKSGRQEVLLFGTIFIISAYATFIYICLEPLKDHCGRISRHRIFQIFSGNAVLYILFSTPVFYDLLMRGKQFHEEVVRLIHPILDILIFTFVLLMMTLCYRKRLAHYWRWISITFLLMIAGDMFFTYYTVLNISYLSQLAGIFYNVAYGLLVFGLLVINLSCDRSSHIHKL